MQIDNSTKIKNRLSAVCIYLYIAILPLSYVNIGSFGSLYKLVSMCLLFIVLLDSFAKIGTKIHINKMMGAWLLYFFYCAISLLWTPRDVYFRTTGLVSVGLISLLFTIREFSQEEFENLKNAWVISSIVLILLFFTTRRELSMSDAGRYSLFITGSLVDANEYAASFCAGVSIELMNVLNKNKKITHRILSLVLLTVMLFVVLRTGSRGGLVSVLTTIVVTSYISMQKNKKVVLLVATLSIVAYFTYTRIVPMILPDTVISRLSISSAIETRGTHRFDIWIKNLKIYGGGNIFRIIFGYGLSGLPGSVCHNNFLQNLVGLGLVGEVLYIRVLYYAYKQFRQTNKQLYLGAYVGIIVSSLFLTVWSSNKMWWTLFVLPLMSICSLNDGVVVTNSDQNLENT